VVLAPPSTAAPVTVAPEASAGRAYLVRLGSVESRRTMAASLRALAQAGGFPAELDPLAVPWEQLTYAQAQELRAAVAARYAPRSAAKHLSALRGVLREAWRLGLIDREKLERLIDLAPVRGSRLPRGRALTAEELGKLLDGADVRLAAVLTLAAFCGLRRSEIAALDVGAFDPAGEGSLAVLGKGNKERRLPLPPGGKERLQSWLHVRGGTPGKLFCAADKWGNYHPERGFSAQEIYRQLVKLAAAVGVARFAPHDLRRTYVTTLLDRGVDVLRVSQLAGHASLQTTQTYDRRGEAARREAVQVLQVPGRRPPAGGADDGGEGEEEDGGEA